ncbi:hypothetical protein WJX82_004831 [Trebouxia sp. C0006]
MHGMLGTRSQQLMAAEAHHSHRQHERAHAHPKAVAPGLAELEVVAPDSVKQAGASRSQVQEAQAALPEASTFTSAAQALAADNKTSMKTQHLHMQSALTDAAAGKAALAKANQELQAQLNQQSNLNSALISQLAEAQPKVSTCEKSSMTMGAGGEQQHIPACD